MADGKFELATDQNFDERAYLVANPDVMDYIGLGEDSWGHFDGFGRNEARLQLATDPLRTTVFYQTCDTFKYGRMLAATSKTVIEYCRLNGYLYEMSIGVRRGYWGWQSVYNRIAFYKDKLDQGFAGWAVYLDADAFIANLDFDLHDYLREKTSHAAILARAGHDVQDWNINGGVTMINLGHPQGRRIVTLWHEAFMALSDDWLRNERVWSSGHNDQDMLQRILRDNKEILDAVLIDREDTINSTTARFIRQRLRAQFDDFPSRVAAIESSVRDVFARTDRRLMWA